jgi:hypothetical protein
MSKTHCPQRTMEEIKRKEENFQTRRGEGNEEK